MKTKTLILVLLPLAFAACGSRKDGCGTESYKHKFRVERIERKGDSALVRLRHYQEIKTVLLECLPDSIKVGRYVRM